MDPRLDWMELGLDPNDVVLCELWQERPGARLYRLETHEGRFIAKMFPLDRPGHEIAAYRLLSRCGVSTISIHASSDAALLMEDLNASAGWRLAEANDMDRATTGVAVARWYREFHDAGRAFLEVAQPPAWLRRDHDVLSAAVLPEMAQSLGLENSPVWKLLEEHIDALLAAYRAMPTTFNYNDFHVSNLALTHSAPMRAVCFDFHLLGLGIHYSDCRNVVGSLGPRAAEAFWDAYGLADPREVVLAAR